MPKQVRPDLAALEIGKKYPVDSTSQKPSHVIFAQAKRQLSKVITIAHQHIEGVKLHLVMVLSAMQSIEV